MKRGGWIIAVVVTFVLGFGAAWFLFRDPPKPEGKPVPAPLAMPRFAPPSGVTSPPPAATQPSPPTTQPALPAERPEPEPPPPRRPPPEERIPATVSFQPGQVWRGQYVCAQGATDLELTIDRVSFNGVTAIFSFRHGPTGAAGEYYVHGEYQPRTRRIAFSPGAWIEEPPNYFPVGMDGHLAMDGRSFSGRITHPSCTSFLLRLR